MMTRGEILKHKRESLGLSLSDLSLMTGINLHKLTLYEGGKHIVPVHYTSMCNALDIDPNFMGIGNRAYEISHVFKDIIPVVADRIYNKEISWEHIYVLLMCFTVESPDAFELQGGPEIWIIDRMLSKELEAKNTIYNFQCVVDCYLWQYYGRGLNKENTKYKVVYLQE